MRRSGSTRLAVTASLFLAASGLSGCYKSYVRAHVDRCPPMSVEIGEELLTVTDSPSVIYVADEIIPYCAGIDALLDE